VSYELLALQDGRLTKLSHAIKCWSEQYSAVLFVAFSLHFTYFLYEINIKQLKII